MTVVFVSVASAESGVVEELPIPGTGIPVVGVVVVVFIVWRVVG